MGFGNTAFMLVLSGMLFAAAGAQAQPAGGAYKAIKDGPPFASQDFLMQLAEGKADLAAIPRSSAPKAPARRPPRR